MNLHFYSSFNNYYNRKLIVYPTIDGYEAWEDFLLEDVNFNPNDGITTNHIVGGPITYNGQCDYCIAEEDNEIVSRWFVLENRRTRGGQYEVVLKRDSVADYAGPVFSAPCFVEKGWVPDTDSAIFNSEQMTFNQIKKDEILLKDSTRVPWLVGYYTKQDTALSATIEKIEPTADITVNGIENWTYYNRLTDPAKIVNAYTLDLYFKIKGLSDDWSRGRVSYTGLTSNDIKLKSSAREDAPGVTEHYTIDGDLLLWGILGGDIDQDAIKNLTEQLTLGASDIWGYADNYFTGYLSIFDYEEIAGLPGKTIFDSTTGDFYKIKGRQYIGRTTSKKAKVQLTDSLGYEFYDIYSATNSITGSRPTKNSSYDDFILGIDTYTELYLELEKVNYGAVNATINPSAAGQTLNSPFNIFAIPFGEIRVIDNGTNVYTSETLAMRTAMALIEQYSGASGVLHDLQLLPYCPIQEVRESTAGGTNPRLNLAEIPDYLYSRMTDGENTVGYIFNCPSTSAQFSLKRLIDIKDYKIENETQFCRLCSPNWNGTYEFSPAKNRGLEYINVDMELKPFSPYIHLAPQFNESGLYGLRDGDPIGLICGGDFGLTMISDAWAAYERQNKNYQNIFDRQIQNLEVQQKWGRFQDIAGAATGALSGATGGAMIGSMIPGGMGIGAGVGAAASAGAGLADVLINEQLRKETIDYTKDLFGFQMGNVRALPDSLTKVNSFNPNNTIFPILEFYGCTDEETEALRNKIKYNGMTIGRIGALKDFRNPAEETYLKGQLIRLEIPEDSHFVSDLAAEIYKGVRV